MSDEPKQNCFKVGSDEIDFSNLAPITLGDKKKLRAEGVDFMKYARERVMEPEDEAKLVLHLIRKLRPATTMEEVEELPVLTASSFLQYAMKKSAEVDDPFSTRSTTSDRPTGGASAKSESAPSTS